MLSHSLTDNGACFNSRCAEAMVVAQLCEEVFDGVAACNLSPASQEADMDPDVASEAYVRSHQRLDRHKIQTLKSSKYYACFLLLLATLRNIPSMIY
jgi:hypothetical protein